MSAPTERPFDGAYLVVNYGDHTQQVTWYPSLTGDPASTRATIESVRAWIAGQGFTDDVPHLQRAWFNATLDDELATVVGTRSMFANDWPSVYAALGLDPPTT